ncbi:MAG: UDP-N-acetylmuramoyl-L-alanyl-D-glutamate--2,6-diaminopimelate ligase [Patescibacteria group bacterium]
MIKSFVRRFLPKPLLALYHRSLASLADFWYRHPSNELIVIGVTGTNGKSTVVSLIGQLLEHVGHRVGWTSTASFKIGQKEWLNDKKMTMLGRFQLQQLLRQMVVAGCEFAIVETSSEGIKQSRHFGINYDVAVITNLTPEHIESHGGFENYKQAKLELFRHLTRQPRKGFPSYGDSTLPKIAVLNGDDSHFKEFLAPTADKKIVYAVDGDVELTADGSRFHALGLDMFVPLLGRFNVQNTLAAISVVKEFGMSPDQIAEAVSHLKPVPGRLERIDEGQPFTVIVDYSPDPDSMTKLYEEIVPLIQHKRIIHVFGSCGGGRDVARRPLLGKISGSYANLCIVTNEDPYDDDPLEIMRQVAVGARQAGKLDGVDLFIVPDRREAIRKAIGSAQAEDIVLITGKASEQAMVLAGGKMLAWDDRVEARAAINSRL